MYYIHRYPEIRISTSCKAVESYCVIGPFESVEEAEKWVETHLSSHHAMQPPTDIRVKPPSKEGV